MLYGYLRPYDDIEAFIRGLCTAMSAFVTKYLSGRSLKIGFIVFSTSSGNELVAYKFLLCIWLC